MSAIGACASVGSRADASNVLRARCEANGSARDCRILNLTPHKVFVESFVPVLTGSEVTLRFDLPNGHQVCTAGVVSNHEFARGFGVNFTGISKRDADIIAGLLG